MKTGDGWFKPSVGEGSGTYPGADVIEVNIHPMDANPHVRD